MRILVVHNRYRSGQPSGENAVVDDEARLLGERGHDVELVQLESDAIANWPLARRLTLPGRVVWSRDGERVVRQAADRFRPDVVHVHNTFPLFSPTALRAAHTTGAAVVATLHNFRPLCAAATFLRDGKVCHACLGNSPLPAVVHGCYRGSSAATVPVAAMIAVHRLAATWRSSVDRYVVPSSFARSLYVQAGWRPETLVVKANTAPDPGRARLGPGTGFVALARFAPEKGLDVLLRAWAEAGIDEPLTLVGAGEALPSLRRLADGLPNVTFAGQLPREAALELLSTARALVVPSVWYEVFPRVVVESFAHGVPVIASRIGSLADVVSDGATGLLAAPGSPSDLASQLRRLAADDLLSLRLGAAARATYERELAPAPTTERLEAIYREALDARSRPVAA